MRRCPSIAISIRERHSARSSCRGRAERVAARWVAAVAAGLLCFAGAKLAGAQDFGEVEIETIELGSGSTPTG